MMSWAGMLQMEWTQPWWGLLALQPVLVALLLRLRRNQVLHYADAHLLAWVVRGNLGMTQTTGRTLMNLFAWLLLACALAGPRLPLTAEQGQPATPQHEMDVMVLLDVSPSMQAQDISPQRLQRAKLELLDLLPRLHGERLGLIAYSGSAAQIMPLSRDYAAMKYYLQIAEPELFDKPGTAIASALALALRKFPPEQHGSRAILLLSDAETSALSGPAGAALWEMADKLRAADIRLYILGVGTAAGATIPQANGMPLVDEGADVISRMDPDGFQSLANRTGGRFIQVADGHGDWQALYHNGILTLPGGKQPVENVQSWQQQYRYFLLPALLLFWVIYFPLKFNRAQPAALLAAILLGMLTGTGMQDAQADEVEAYAAYRNQQLAQAQALYAAVEGYAARMGEGAAAYRRKDYPYAIRQFSAALLASRDQQQRQQALYNLGNSYFLAGAYRAAADAFLGVMKYAPAKLAENLSAQPDNTPGLTSTLDKGAELYRNARANLALSAGKLAELGKAAKNTQGIPGRRGRETGGKLGDDASKQPLILDETEEKKDGKPAAGNKLSAEDKASLIQGVQRGNGSIVVQVDETENAYRAALKKLELARDDPLALHKALVKLEAAREYVPQMDMAPW